MEDFVEKTWHNFDVDAKQKLSSDHGIRSSLLPCLPPQAPYRDGGTVPIGGAKYDRKLAPHLSKSVGVDGATGPYGSDGHMLDPADDPVPEGRRGGYYGDRSPVLSDDDISDVAFYEIESSNSRVPNDQFRFRFETPIIF